MREFKIPTHSKSTTKTIRFPNDLIEEIENTIVCQNCTFTAFVVAAVKFALENVQEKEKQWDTHLFK